VGVFCGIFPEVGIFRLDAAVEVGGVGPCSQQLMNPCSQLTEIIPRFHSFCLRCSSSAARAYGAGAGATAAAGAAARDAAAATTGMMFAVIVLVRHHSCPVWLPSITSRAVDCSHGLDAAAGGSRGRRVQPRTAAGVGAAGASRRRRSAGSGSVPPPRHEYFHIKNTLD
jgi:hypothetical protein